MLAQANIAEQAKTIDCLLSMVDNLTVVPDECNDGALVFEGDGIEGPCIGYIEPDGKVSWLVQG